MNILLLYNSKGESTNTNSHLLQALSEFLKERHNCRLQANYRSPLRYIASLPSRLKQFLWADVIVLHTYALFSLDLILLSKVLRKKTVVFAWDEYPLALNGEPVTSTVLERARDRFEAKSLALVDSIVVPSRDFKLAHTSAAEYFPLWPANNMLIAEGDYSHPEWDTIKIAFAGNINYYRGLEDCLAQLDALATERVEVHIFSRQSVAHYVQQDLAKVKVIERGFVSRKELDQALSQMHFGLISLHPEFTSAGFPSKVFDYVAAGLPVLYYGPKLTHFIELLEDTGVGCSIVGIDELDLQQISSSYGALRRQSLTKFFDATRLRWERFDKIL